MIKKINNPSSIENIIFDFGGVIMNIDFQKTIESFGKLGVKDFDKLFSKHVQSSLFDKMDKGTISPAGFRNQVRELTGIHLSDQEIDRAWNDLLLDYPPHRIDLIQQLKQNYSLYLLSNTNEIHYREYSEIFFQHYHFPFETLFKKAYWSFNTGMRKPDREIFDLVISENSLDPAKTLFIDDTEIHVNGALKAGINAYHLGPGEDISTLFAEGKLKTL